MTNQTQMAIPNRRLYESTTSHKFRKTPVGSYTTVSDHLRVARERNDLTLAECSSALNIQEKYLDAIEQSRYSDLPHEVYIKLWIKKYAAFLRLNVKSLLISYEKERGIRKKIIDQKHGVTFTAARSMIRTVHSRHVIVALALMAIVGYLGITMNRSLSKPQIIFTPALEDMRTQSDVVTLAGKTEPGVIVTVNQQPITLSADGEFNEEIVLRSGLNTYTIEAKKKHGRRFTRVWQIIRTEAPAAIINQENFNNN